MAIVRVEQRGKVINVYDKDRNLLFDQVGTLLGYTSEYITVKKEDGSVYIYDEHNRQIY